MSGNLFCIFCGKQQEALSVPTSGTFQGVGYLFCKSCNGNIKFFVEEYPRKNMKNNLDIFIEQKL